MKKLRVGFLIDELKFNQYEADVISFVENHENFDRPFIITGYKKKINENLFNKLIKKLYRNPLINIDIFFKIIFIKIIKFIEIRSVNNKYPKYKKVIIPKDLNSYELLNIEGLWSKSGTYLEFTKDDVERISNLNLNCIIRFGSGILRGDIINSTEFGIISFHHGDNRLNRGGPSGFWEVLNHEPSSGFIIQKINNELDGGEVLLRGNIMTADLWLHNNAQLLEKSNIFLINLLKNLSINLCLPKPEGVRLHSNKIYKIENSFTLIKYISRIIIPKIFKSILTRLFSPSVDRWSIAYAEHNNYSKSLWRYNEVKNPLGRFLADPFVYKYKENNYIFVEDFFYEDNKGRISVLKINNNSHEFLGIVLEEDFHLSFPFIFNESGNIYMVPESSKNNDIRLYKCIDFPHKWVLEKVIMTDVNAADTMIIKNNNSWFLLTNICSANNGDHQSELHIFYSKDFRNNSWKEINISNPVVIDSMRARNGGIFSHRGITYRVNQVHGQEHYGKSFYINEIKKINEDEYIEERVSEIKPNFIKNINSTHHFHANNTLAVIDFARKQRLNKAIKS